jgi:23S rRNA (guanosine2251-2'-O)-methyltransferase
MVIYGINPVLEALKAGRVRSLMVGDRAGARMTELLRLAAQAHVEVRRVPEASIDRAAGGGVHQGVVAEVAPAATMDLGELLAAAASPALVVVLDGIEDPRNLGAILRTADAAGVDGVIRQSRRAAPLDGIAAKASAGAVAHVKVAEVVNIARALEELKQAGLWIVGLSGDAPTRYDEVDFTLPTALVLGAEGTGLRRLVRERCDWVATIPMRGQVSSLNVAVAAGVALFEAIRQRACARSGDTGPGSRPEGTRSRPGGTRSRPGGR